MTKFVDFYNQLIVNIEGNSVYFYIILTLIVITFIIQLYYYIYYFRSITKKRNRPIIREKEAVSVVVVIRDNLFWVENILPAILAQNYSKFEVIAIDTGEDMRVSELLDSFKKLYSHLIITRFTHNHKFPISNKMAYNVGIKCSSTNNILLTTTQSRPTSEFWVSEFANEFCKSDVILGYAGVERENNNFTTKLIRLTRVVSAIRHLSSAANGKPYRGFIHNFGFRKDLYFTANGFNFLNMNVGEDDLFLQKIATKDNTSILITSNSSVVESLSEHLPSYRAYRRYFDYTFKFYPKQIKFSIILERLIRTIFFTLVFISLFLFPLILKLTVIGLVIIRTVVVIITIKKIARKLGESQLLSALPLHDFIYPLDSFIMYIHRVTRPIRSIWR